MVYNFRSQQLTIVITHFVMKVAETQQNAISLLKINQVRDPKLINFKKSLLV